MDSTTHQSVRAVDRSAVPVRGRWRRAAAQGLEQIEGWFDRVFAPAWNPWYQLGALGWFFYWIVIASGIYLYIFFDTGIAQAYDSVERLTVQQWYAGGLLRSLHRYASDALIVVVLLHLAREFVLGRLYGARWFAWVTGVVMLWFIYASGITGYWLVWDRLAQYVALVTTEWLDALPFFGEPVARNFLSDATLNGRFFTLMVFIHIAVPLILLFIMWMHIQRYAQPKVNPPRGLAAGMLLALVGLSLLKPAVSQGRADLSQVPSPIGLDWWYLTVYPLVDRIPGGTLWAILIGATCVLLVLPWVRGKLRPAVALVSLENCNGCGRCVVDCPFSAIDLEPRSDGKPFEKEAVVRAARCVSCGICAGACPTATPFRRRTELVAGIDLPDQSVAMLREATISALQALSDPVRVIVYGCQAGPDLARLRSTGIAAVPIPCVGMLPPAFIDLVLSRKLAQGVFFTGCREGDCYQRLGITWTEQRLARQRDPRLRERVPDERVRHFWGGLTRIGVMKKEIEAFRVHLQSLSDAGQPAPGATAAATGEN